MWNIKILWRKSYSLNICILKHLSSVLSQFLPSKQYFKEKKIKLQKQLHLGWIPSAFKK